MWTKGTHFRTISPWRQSWCIARLCVQKKKCWRVKKWSVERHSAQMANCCVGSFCFGEGFDNPTSLLFKAYWPFKRWQKVVFCLTAAQPPDLVITFQSPAFSDSSTLRAALEKLLVMKNPCGWKAESERKKNPFHVASCVHTEQEANFRRSEISYIVNGNTWVWVEHIPSVIQLNVCIFPWDSWICVIAGQRQEKNPIRPEGNIVVVLLLEDFPLHQL